MLRIATWNIELGMDLERVIAGVGSLPHLDLLALQELSIHEGVPDAQRISKKLGPKYRCVQFTAQDVGGLPQANGMVWDSSRLDVAGAEVIPLPTPTGRLMRLRDSRRNAIVAEACLGALSLRVYVVHLDVLGVTHKHAQLTHVLEDAGARPAVDLVLIAGDLNTYGVAGRPRWFKLRRLAREAGFEELTTGIGWTQRRLGVRQKLDAVFASPPGTVHRAWREVLPGSDHLPVLAELDVA